MNLQNLRRYVGRTSAVLAFGLLSVSRGSAETKRAVGAEPSAARWDAAEKATGGRIVGELARQCDARELDGWLRVRCNFPVSAMTELGGPTNGVRLLGASADERGLPRDGSIVLPFGSEGARAFVFWTIGEGYDGPLTIVPAVVLQANTRGPQREFFLHDALHEPVRTAHGIERERTRLTPANEKP